MPTPLRSIADDPRVMRFFDPHLNAGVDPRLVPRGSARTLFWRCPEGPDHVWSVAVHRRANGAGCPFCAGKKISATNRLSAVAPALARDWHPTKNGKLTPDDVTKGYNRLVWWRCTEGPDHEWRATVNRRTASNTGCPFCAGRKISLTNRLSAVAPALAAQWHPTKNGKLTPNNITTGTARRIWWRCPKGPDHVWAASVFNRARRGAGCPFCGGDRASVTNRLSTVAPGLARDWHPTKNGKLTPDDVTKGYGRPIWWRCTEGPDHEWCTAVNQRTSANRGCPFCAGKKVSVTNRLSAVAPALAAQWHPTKNGKLTPDDVVTGSRRQVWWQCRNGPDHVWMATIAHRKGHGCPYCANIWTSVTNCLSHMAPDVARQWHPTRNRPLTPDDVTAGSTQLAWWRCPAGTDHVWRARIAHRAAGRTGCPFCAGQRVSKTNSLAARRPEVAAEWHPRKNGKLTPRDVTAGSPRKAWWKCPKGPDHEWEQPIAGRSRAKNPCPFCLGQRVSVTNCLATLYPALALQWHPAKNGSLSPSQIHGRSKRQVWWLCPAGHVWRTTVQARSVNHVDCHGCRHRKGRQALTRKRRRKVWLPGDWQ